MISIEEIKDAYTAQNNFVKEEVKQRGIGGYKAAASSKAAQKSLGLHELMVGVLYKDGEIKSGSAIRLSDYVLPKIETEIGFRLGKDVLKKTSATTVKECVELVLPVFEVPEIKAENPDNFSVPEMISKNTFASYCVCGTAIKVADVDVNGVAVKLYHNEVLINEAKGSDALNNQWEALSRALNLNMEHGYSPKKGDLVITGALGKILPLEKGEYRADYGALGELHLSVE